MSGLYLQYHKILANENIHYDVDENLWPNQQDRVDKNKCSEEYSSLHFTVDLL